MGIQKKILLSFPLIVTTPLTVYDHTHIDVGGPPLLLVSVLIAECMCACTC